MEHRARIEAYFDACGTGAADDIASHFTTDATVFDTNVRPMRGALAIGESWVVVRERWQGAKWSVDSLVSDGEVAAIEWSMTGTDPNDQRAFVFRGSEHYRFGGEANLIEEIRQYWTFDPVRLDSGLRGFNYDV